MSSYRIVTGLQVVGQKVLFTVNYGNGKVKQEALCNENKVPIAEFWMELSKKITRSKLLKPVLSEAKEESTADSGESQVDDGESVGSSFLARSSEASEMLSSGKEDPEEDITNDSLAEEIAEAAEAEKPRGRAYIDDSD